MSNDDLALLISNIALADRKAFVVLYNQTSSKLFAICLRILKNRTEAEEALQEVYIKIWQRSRLFSTTSGTPDSWLATIARNQSIDMIRKRKPVASELDTVADLSDDTPDPEQTTLTKDTGHQIDLCLSELERNRADAVRYAYIEGMSYQELAERYAVPLNTMRTWLRRSLIKLKECMER
jgi:RNA polymerase sigma-70 factor, ECF subfamily